MKSERNCGRRADLQTIRLRRRCARRVCLFFAIARLEPGLSTEAAQAHLDALVDALKKQYPADYPAASAWTVRVIPLSESLVGGVRQSLILLFGAVGWCC